MGDRYLYSENATPVAPFDTPETAANTLTAILSLTEGDVVAVGETIWVHASHVDTHAGNYQILSPASATPAVPQKVICVDNFTDMNLATGAEVRPADGGNRAHEIYKHWFIYGCTLGPQGAQHGLLNPYNGSGLNAAFNQVFVLHSCLIMGGGHANNRCFIGGEAANASGAGMIEIKDCVYYPEHANHCMYFGNIGTIHIDNLLIHTSATAPTSLFSFVQRSAGYVEVTNSDLSNKAFANLIGFGALYSGERTSHVAKFINCKFPAAVTIVDDWKGFGPKIYLINCDSGNTNHRWELHQYQGTIKLDTGVYATTSPALYESELEYSLRMDTSADASRYLPLQSEWVHKWHDAGTHTLDVECLVGADGADALKTCELYFEVDYISGASSPLGSRATTTCNILEVGADNPAGTTAWTGDGYAVERTHKLSAAVTSSKNGYIRYRVCLAKPSTTVYFNPV